MNSLLKERTPAILNDVLEIFQLPRVRIHLMLEKTKDNDPFYAEAVKHFYREASSPHPKLLFAAGKYEYGFSLCDLSSGYDAYFAALEASARRNYRKAQRLEYHFKRFDYNAHLEDIRDIWMSTPIRQGVVPETLREGQVRAISDPASRSAFQDYPYYGIFQKERLVAYAGCLVTGELCSLNDLYGHADFLPDGVVPYLIIETARELLSSFPAVRYYGYGTYFGASETMRRFKRKFNFNPHRVSWILSSPPAVLPPGETLRVYWMDVQQSIETGTLDVGRFITVNGIRAIVTHWAIWMKNWGLKESLKALFKVFSGRRHFFGIVQDKTLIHSGWANIGWCRHYPVEPDAVVLGTLWTHPAWRGRGLAPASLRRIINHLFFQGSRRFYIDVESHNHASQRMIEKTGFIESRAAPIRHDRSSL